MEIIKNQFIKRILLALVIFSVIGGGFNACTSARNEPTTASSNSTSTNVAGSGGENTQNHKSANIDAEKEKLKKEREKLEKEKQALNDEKAKTEKMKDAKQPESASQSAYVPKPPSYIRDSPNGKILCTVKKAQTIIKTFGSTEIYDDNGVWIYTNYCGKMGVIHDSQIVNPG